MSEEEKYKTEYRNGFKVSEVMKRSWAADLDALAEIIELCDRHSLKIFACYGTLLGAIREKGFIPWDDDIDMGFVGEDYVRFLDFASKELGNKYRILNPYTRDWYSMNFTHITDLAEPNFSRDYLKRKHGCPFGKGPDVYPYYYIPRNKGEEEYVLNLQKKIDTAIAMNRRSLEEVNPDGSLKSGSRLNEAVAVKLVELQHETGYEFTSDRPIENQLEILYDQVCRITEEAEADYVCRYDEYMVNNNKKFPKEYFETTIKLPFEDIYMPVPIGYDAILKARFGEGFIVPRREAAAHDYPYYRKQLVGKEYLKEQMESGITITSDFQGNKIENNIIPNENDSAKKIKILYHTSIISMLIHCDNAIDKIKEMLDDFLESDCDFWWMPGIFPNTDDCAFDEVAPELIGDYEKLIKEYQDKGGKICGIGETIEKVTAYFDEFVGDEGSVADAFRHAGKNVEIQDYLDVKRNKSIAEKSFQYISNEQRNSKTGKKNESVEISVNWKPYIYKENSEKKKVVMYVNSISVLFQNQQNMFDKIKDVLETFEKCSTEVAFLWYLPEIPDNVKNAFDKDFLKQLKELRDSTVQSNKVIMIDEKQKEIATSITDAVYGDSDAMIAFCHKKGLPIMIQNVNV